MISILNGKRDGWVGEYVGRPMSGRPGSALGNPFKTKAHTVEAHTVVVEQYREWLWQKIKTKDAPVCCELNRLKQQAIAGNLDLICWCAPLPCHADVIGKCISWAIREDIKF